MSEYVLHCTDADTEPDEEGKGGAWLVLCHACSWQKHGRYAGILVTEATAIGMAHVMGSAHERSMNKGLVTS